jgi:ribosomal protein S16
MVRVSDFVVCTLPKPSQKIGNVGTFHPIVKLRSETEFLKLVKSKRWMNAGADAIDLEHASLPGNGVSCGRFSQVINSSPS